MTVVVSLFQRLLSIEVNDCHDVLYINKAFILLAAFGGRQLV